MPTEPRNLIAREIKNTSVELFWEPQLRTNGVFDVYEIWYNGSIVTTRNKADNETNRVAYKLENLKPFSNYTILVRACTQKCSNGSHPIEIETKIGVPSKMASPKVTGNESNVITWDQPEQLNGHLDYYELKIRFKENGRIASETLIKTRQTSCQLHQTCRNLTGIYEFFVRAVNFVPSPHFVGNFSRMHSEKHNNQKCDESDPDLIEWLKLDQYGTSMESDWSNAYSHSCTIITDASQFWLFCALLIVASLVILGLVMYFYRKIKEMKNICVTLPPGLEDLTTDIKNKSSIDQIMRPDLIPIDLPLDSNIEDECLLKRSLNGSVNGDYYVNSSAKSCSSESDSQSTIRSEQDHCDDSDYELMKPADVHLISDVEDNENDMDNSIPRPMVS